VQSANSSRPLGTSLIPVSVLFLSLLRTRSPAERDRAPGKLPALQKIASTHLMDLACFKNKLPSVSLACIRGHLKTDLRQMTDSDPLLPRIASDSTFSSYNSENSPHPRGFSDSPGPITPPSRKHLGHFASASSVCMVFLSMMVHGIFGGLIPHWQVVMNLDELQVGLVEYVFFGSVTLGVAMLYLLRNIDYNIVFPAMFCAAIVAIVSGLLLNPNPTLTMVILCRGLNGFAAGIAMASVTLDLIAPVLLFSSTSVLVGSSLSSLFFEIFNSGPYLHASLDATPTLILLLVPVFVASLSFMFFLTWFARFYVGQLCPSTDEQDGLVAHEAPVAPSSFDLRRILHAASALTQGVVIGTILSTFPLMQTLDAAFFRPIGICHNAYLVIILGKVAAQPSSNMLSRSHASVTASIGCIMSAFGFWLLTTMNHNSFSVVVALFGIGAGSSLLAFPSASIYAQERCATNLRSDVVPAVIEFIGIYFLGVSAVSCLASLKFSGITVRCQRLSLHNWCDHNGAQVGKSAEQSTELDVDLFLRISCGM
jgi:hypothetical protein